MSNSEMRQDAAVLKLLTDYANDIDTLSVVDGIDETEKSKLTGEELSNNCKVNKKGFITHIKPDPSNKNEE